MLIFSNANEVFLVIFLILIALSDIVFGPVL